MVCLSWAINDTDIHARPSPPPPYSILRDIDLFPIRLFRVFSLAFYTVLRDARYIDPLGLYHR